MRPTEKSTYYIKQMDWHYSPEVWKFMFQTFAVGLIFGAIAMAILVGKEHHPAPTPTMTVTVTSSP
jgi:hypothetical protein